MTNPENNDDSLPTVLIVTEQPSNYRSILAVLGSVREQIEASGIRYDVGVSTSSTGKWRVKLPLGLISPDLATRFFAESFTAIILVENWHEGNLEVFSRGVYFPERIGISSSPHGFELVTAAPRQIFELLKLLDMRGRWPNGHPASSEVRFIDESRIYSSLLESTLKMASGNHPIFAIQPHRSADVGLFLKSLLANLDPADFATPATSARAPSPSPPPPAPAIHVTGVIARFETRSVRMFDQLAWEAPAAPAGWHVILGDNASGKTSLLRALALCLLDRSERDALRQAWDSWLRASSDNGEVSVRLGTTDAPSHRLSFSLHRTAAPGTAVDVQSSERLRYSGFLAAYGPFRRFTGGDAEWVKSFKAHPRLQSVLTLFDERAALSDALEWLKDLWIRARTIENAPEKDFLRDLLVFINDTGFLPEGVQILEPDADGIWCLDGNKLRVLAIDLSDGYRAVLSLALDLLRRLSVDAGYDKVFTMEPDQHVAAEGIVLIDEVDAHLHPTWQQRIGEWFKKRFPRMQFIVATHSPVVCQSADSVLLLPPPGSPDEARMATPEELNRLRYGDLLDAFATAFFGELVTRSQAGRDKMDRLAELNDQMFSRELTDEEKQTQDALNRELGMVGGVTPREPAP